MSNKAIRLYQTGGPEVLKLETVDVGAPGPARRVRHTYRGGELHRHLFPHRALSDAAAQRPGVGRGWASSKAVGEASPTSASVTASATCSGPQGAYSDVRVMPEVLIPLPAGSRTRTASAPDDEGHDGAVPVPPGLPLKGGETILYHRRGPAASVSSPVSGRARSASMMIGTVGSEAKAEVARAPGCAPRSSPAA